MDIKHPLNPVNTGLGGFSALSDFHGVFSRVCQVFCVSYKKKFIGEGNLPFYGVCETDTV